MKHINENKIDIWHNKRFIAIPILATAAHFLMSNILYYVVEKLFLDILHIPEARFAKFSYLGEFLIYIILILLFYNIYRLIWKNEKNESGVKTNFKDSLMCSIAGMGVSGISLLWIMLAQQMPSLQKSIDAMHTGNENLAGGSFIGGILIAVISAPIIEEILFRGIVFRSIRKVSPAWLAILLSSILFGAYHLNPVQAVYATFMGIVAGIIYEKKKNLMFPIFVHVANNFIASIQGFVSAELEQLINIFVLIMILPLGYIIYRLLEFNRTKNDMINSANL